MNQEQREEQILLSLKKLDYLTREQLKRLHNLGSKGNMHRILKRMDEYFSILTFEKKHVYYLNREGRDRVNSNKVRKKTHKVKHYLMRNDLYLFLGRPSTWKNEVRIKNVGLIADAVFTKNKVHHFVEIDHKQTMKQNANKLKKYHRLSEEGDFTLIWVTTTPLRKRRLEELSEGLNMTVYTEDDLR